MPTKAPSRLWQVLLLLAALDAAVSGAWAALRPGDLFALLRLPPTGDGLLLCRLLGLLYLTHAVFLPLAAFVPGCGGLALAPLLGRLLACGAWLWLLGSAGRVPASAGALLGLLAHDAVWPPLLAAFLWTLRPKPLKGPELTAGASPAPGLPATPPAPPA